MIFLVIAAGVLKMFEIPAGARHIQIEETEGSSNSFGKNNVILKPSANI